MVLNKVKNILFTFLVVSLTLAGCKQDKKEMIMNYILNSKEKYKSVESFSLEINSNLIQLGEIALTYNNHNRILYEYDYDNKIAHYIDESNSFDYYQMIEDFDYYEFYENGKYKMVKKENYAYEEWSIVLAQNLSYIDAMEEMSDFILNLVKKSIIDDNKEFDKYKIEYTINNGTLNGTLKETEFNVTTVYNFEYDKHILKNLNISTISETYINNVEYIFTNLCSINKINKNDYILMDKNEYSVNEIYYDDRIKNILYSREDIILSVSQFDVTYNYKEVSSTGEVVYETKQYTKADLINGVIYRKSENKSLTTTYYVLEEENGIGLYDVEKRNYVKDPSDFEFVFYNVFVEYFYEYQKYVDAYVLNSSYDYMYLTSDNNYDFDMFVEYNNRFDSYKFDNFIMTYYKSEAKVNNVKIIKEITVDYSTSMNRPEDLKNYKEVN